MENPDQHEGGEKREQEGQDIEHTDNNKTERGKERDIYHTQRKREERERQRRGERENQRQ